MPEPCGCEGGCCGICVHARAVGCSRLLTRADAAGTTAPDLHGYRAKHKMAERNAEDGELMVFFWQVTGKRWGLDGRSFETAKKAHGPRLVVTRHAVGGHRPAALGGAA